MKLIEMCFLLLITFPVFSQEDKIVIIQENYSELLCEIIDSKTFTKDDVFTPMGPLMKLIGQADLDQVDSLRVFKSKTKQIGFSESIDLNNLLVDMLSKCPDFYSKYISTRFILNANGDLDANISQRDYKTDELVKVILALEENNIFKKIKKDKYRSTQASLNFHVSQNRKSYYYYMNSPIVIGFMDMDIFMYFSDRYPRVARKFLLEYTYKRVGPWNKTVHQVDTTFKESLPVKLLPLISTRKEIVSANLINAYSDELINSNGPFYFEGVELSPTVVRKRLEESFESVILYRFHNSFGGSNTDELILNLSLDYGPQLTKPQILFIKEIAYKICPIIGQDKMVSKYFKTRSESICNVFPYRSNKSDSVYSPGENTFVNGDFTATVTRYAKHLCR